MVTEVWTDEEQTAPERMHVDVCFHESLAPSNAGGGACVFVAEEEQGSAPTSPSEPESKFCHYKTTSIRDENRSNAEGGAPPLCGLFLLPPSSSAFSLFPVVSD